MKEPKICKCSHFDFDHEVSQAYGLYHCLECKISCMDNEFKPIPKKNLELYKAKYNLLKIQGVLA